MTRRTRHAAGAALAAMLAGLLSTMAEPRWFAAALLAAMLAAGPRRRRVLSWTGRALLPAGLAAAGTLLFPPPGGDPGATALRLLLRVAAMTAVTATAALRVDWRLLVRGHDRASLLLVLLTREIAVLQRLLAATADALRCRLPGRPGPADAVRYGGGAGAQLLRRALVRSEAAHEGLRSRGVFDADG